MHPKQRSHYDDWLFEVPRKELSPAKPTMEPAQVDQPTTVVVPSTDFSNLVNNDRTAAIGLFFLILLWTIMFKYV